MEEKKELLDQDERVVEIELERLRGFVNHPFKVQADSQMIELQESIKKYGILNPLIVRPRQDGTYEIISGHRRKFAAEKIGYRKVPVIIRVLKDDEAVVSMVDSNLQREMISPSEKAFAYKMKYEAIKRKAGRRKCGQVDHNLGKKSIELIGEECGDSPKQVQRYIKITELIPEMLEKVDDGSMGFTPAVQLSFLKKKEQKEMLDAMEFAQCTPSLSQALRIKKLSADGKLTVRDMEDILSEITGSIKDVINLIDNLDKYEIYPGVESNADLGHYYIEELGMMEVPDYLADYIDYEAYGRDVAINEMGQFTDYGYVRDTQESFTEYYDGDRENIPDEYRVMDFMVSGEKERKTMNYETFKQEFAEDIKEKLYERGYEDVKISFNNVEKTNQNYEAMSVVPEGNNVGVNFNIENAFASYEHTDDYAGVLASATMVIADGLDRAPAIDVSALMDYENMKEKLSVEVISADANADLLANVPHDRMEDLAVVYRFVMESSEDGRASILVTNNLMDRMGVSHEQLRSDALENSPEIRPVVIMGMNEVMKEMMGPEVYEMFGIPDDAEETMYVATVPDKNSGAGVIAYQDFMDQAAERVGGDFFVLPSSINEILLVPDNGDMTADALRDMVQDVNAKEVSPEERLSDNVYHYDATNHVFELAEKFEARQQEKKTEIDEKSEEKGSILKDLKDKQKEAAAKPPVKDAAEKAAKTKGGEVL